MKRTTLMTAGLAVAALTTTAVAQATDMSDWYKFSSETTLADSPIAMDDWQTERAGTHGYIRMVDDDLVYNGKPIKLWGSNLTYSNIFPEKDFAERLAEMYRRLGVNSIRFHKFADGGAWAGVMSDESIVEFNPDKLDRMDYLAARLAESGIYVKLSANFGIKIGPEDRSRVPWFDEIGKDGARVDPGHGAYYLAREIQDMQIEQIVKFLNHRNPYTGKRYAEDPAIWCVEFVNEDAALFYGTNTRLRTLPTLRDRNAALFADWLKEKYGTEEAWRNAWGEEAVIGEGMWESASSHLRNLVEPDGVKGELKPESLEGGYVVPWGQPWYYDAAMRDTELSVLRQRFVDTMLFLTDRQNEFYGRMQQAIRDTGFQGVLLAGNWQTGNNVPHFLNLYSDHRFGLIDRHNYFRGPRQALRRSTVDLHKNAMVNDPGSTLLSSGMQQVIDRPFMLSEWIHEQPSEWYLEGPAILGAYGLGLNGWDVSYIFENGNEGHFTHRVGRDSWDVMTPMVAGTFPAVARMVRRMDVRESPLVIPLKVHPESLMKGDLTASFFTVQQADVKGFESTEVPNDAMAVGRVVTEFTDRREPTPTFDLEPHRGPDGALESVTDQLRWMPGEEGNHASGWFTIHTDATVGFVGFAPEDGSFELGPFTIEPEPGFGAVYITAIDQDGDLTSGGDLLILAMARGRNADVEYNEDETRLLKVGSGPLLLEPVKAKITVNQGDVERVQVLDHDGVPTGRSLELDGKSFAIDGAKDKTPYYLLSWR